MDFDTFYVIVSATMLLWLGCIWSSKVGLNILIKSLFIIAALMGAVVAARVLAL